MTLYEFLQNDKTWQDTKLKRSATDTEKLLTRKEYLKLVGYMAYSESAYREYKTMYLLKNPNEENTK